MNDRQTTKYLDSAYTELEKKYGNKFNLHLFPMAHKTRVDMEGMPLVTDVPKAMVEEFQKRGWYLLTKSAKPIKRKPKTVSTDGVDS